MKKNILVFITVLILTSVTAFAQGEKKPRLDGLYFAKTGVIKIPNNNMDIFTYIRFYEDGTVYTQTVNAFAPEEVSKWFGKNGRFERKGTYKINDANITFIVTNDKSEDKRLEGAKIDKYSGKILDNNKLLFEVTFNDGTVKEISYEFTPTNNK
ncbi:hypothetical protein [Kordia sp.]|uniref:hypothetical protein n=1 Tax=Kordia sp. TaxID=1965332 RepID=UPI003D6B93AF